MKYTPRTDEKNDELLDQDSYTSWLEMSQFARQLERELNAAKDRIKRLEEAGDKLYETVACGCGMSGPCRSCRDATDKWDEYKEIKP